MIGDIQGRDDWQQINIRNYDIADLLNDVELSENRDILYTPSPYRTGEDDDGGPLWADYIESRQDTLNGCHQFVGHSPSHAVPLNNRETVFLMVVSFCFLYLSMKAEIRKPQSITEYPGNAIISNLTNQIDQQIAAAIKSTNFFSRYAAWNFNGIIWWNDELGYWCAEIWRFNNYVASYLAETLEELAHEIDGIYSGGETPGFF